MVLTLTAVSFWSCSDDEDDIEVANGALYKLTLINGTDSEIEVFFLGNEQNAEFESKGLLGSGEELVISNLVVRQTYVIGAADPGGSTQEYFYEQTLNRTSPTDISLTINR